MYHHEGCGCRDCDECGACDECKPDPCHCRCCIGDADLVIYSRVGEQRVVPIVIENNRRRERHIHLDLSNWTSRGGKPAPDIAATLTPGTDFTLGACQEKMVTLQVDAASKGLSHGSTLSGGPAEQPHGDATRQMDVDDCEVFYADLRVDGCDIRPVRIALALLPRDCGAYEVDCRCGCCC